MPPAPASVHHTLPLSHATAPRSAAYQRATKEANEWIEAAQSAAAEAISHDLDPTVALPRLEFLSEPRVAAASVLRDIGGGAAADPRLASLPQPSFRFVTAEGATNTTEPESSLSSPEAIERTDDLSFEARHAPYELLERRGFAAHPCAARQLELIQTTSSGGATTKTSPLASAEELRRRQVEVAQLPDGGKQLGSAVAAQLVGQRLLVPTHVFGDAPSNFVFDGIVRRRTRSHADRVDVTFWVDGKTNSFNAMQALEWVDLSAAAIEDCQARPPLQPSPAPPPPAATSGPPKKSGRKMWLETPWHDKWLAQ